MPTDRRWFTRLHADFELDVWLISWVPATTELHDHSGSLGALTVLSRCTNTVGTVCDCVAVYDAGDQAGFPLGWVHDVVGARRDHAQRARLFAAADGDVVLRGRQRGTLRRTRTELTDEPEGQ